MQYYKYILIITVIALFSISCSAQTSDMKKEINEVNKTDEEWRKALTPEQYNILREKGTEIAFTGVFWNTYDKGTYNCAGCNTTLFSSETKYKSGCGWPSFWDAVDDKLIKRIEDKSFGMTRIEIQCSKCGGHLGHVFNDGPKPTGERYCLNSAALTFKGVDVK